MRETPLAVWGRQFPPPLLLMPRRAGERPSRVDPSKRGKGGGQDKFGEWQPMPAFVKVGRRVIEKVILLDASEGTGGNKIGEYVHQLRKQLDERGIEMCEPRFAKLHRGRSSLRDLEEAIKAVAGGQKPDMVVAIIKKTVPQVNASVLSP